MVFESVIEHLSRTWPLYLTLLILLGGIVAMVIGFAVSERHQHRFASVLAEQTSSVRVYIVDIPRDTVTYFNVSSLSKVKRESLSDFYNRFPISEQKKVINWINAVSDPTTQTPDSLETDVTDSSNKKQYFSLLQIDSVDHRRQIIHLSSYLLKYMVTAKGSSSGINYHGLSTAKDLTKAIALRNKKKGVSICFRFVHRQIQEKDREIDPLIMNQLKNILYAFVGTKRFLVQCSGNELLLSDLNITGKPTAIYLARSCLLSLNRHLAINGYQSEIEVRCGLLEHAHFPNDGDTIISETRRMAEIAYEEGETLAWYEKGRESRARFSDLSYRTEVERIISEKKIAYSFRPILAVKQKEVVAYFVKAEPKDTYFDSLDELKDYAVRTTDDRELFSTIARNTIPLFVTERRSEKEKLFFNIRSEERGYMLHVFAKIPQSKAANLIFLFRENDLRTHLDPNATDNMIEDLRQIKAKGYDVGVLLEQSELTLPSEIYGVFDYFVVSFSFAGNASEMDSRIRAKLHSLVERLLKYHKPIVATDIQGWASIELLVRSGMNYVSSQDLAPYDPMILPLAQKSLRKIVDFTK